MSDEKTEPSKFGKAEQSAAADFLNKLSTPIAKLAAALSAELYQAIAYYGVFTPTGSDLALLGRVNRVEIHPGFNVVSESLQLGCILALCRLWDKSGDAAHIPAIANKLKRKGGAISDQDALRTWFRDVEAFDKSEELKALREFRNVSLAHRADPNRPDPRIKRQTRRVVEGDERTVLNATVDLVDRLNVLVDYPHAALGDLRKEWILHGAAFWEHVAKNTAETAGVP